MTGKTRDALHILRSTARKIRRCRADVSDALLRRHEIRVLELDVLTEEIHGLAAEIQEAKQELQGAHSNRSNPNHGVGSPSLPERTERA